jgi:1-deoxyxylulose-5-phosphate synthase
MQVLEREVHGDLRYAGSGFPEAELEIGRTVERLSQDWGLRPYQVSLAWLLSRQAVASALVGAETVEELTPNASAPDVVLDQAQLDALTTLRIPRHLSGVRGQTGDGSISFWRCRQGGQQAMPELSL